MKIPPSPPRPTLDALLEKARKHVMTDEERFEQCVSWVYGELGLAGVEMTKDEVRECLRRRAFVLMQHC